MNGIGPGEVEIRILGCLIEKQRTTPDQYPLTLNALLQACNQSTNREPVVDYDEATVREALDRLIRRRWVRSASGHAGRVPKYRHLLEEELRLQVKQLAVLAVLMLRGAQTPGELKQRAERLHHLDGLDDARAALEELIDRGLAERLPRRAGQKEERYRQLLGGGDQLEDDAGVEPERGGAAGESVDVGVGEDEATAHTGGRAGGAGASAAASGAAGAGQGEASPGAEGVEARLASVEAEVRALRRELDALRDEGRSRD